MKKLLLKCIRIYQKHSPVFIFAPGLLVSPQCKFHPTCSEYALTSIEQHGVRGAMKAIIRIIRCNPFSKGGIDLP